MRVCARFMVVAGGLTMVAAGPVSAQRVATREIVWPAPPEEPRIAYAGSLHSEADFGKKPSFFSKMFRAFAGGRAQAVREVRRPFDVYVDRAGTMYVTDGLLPAVLVFDPTAKEARQLGEDVPGGLRKPMGLAGDSQGRIYLADAAARRIVVFASDGTYLRAFGGPELLNPVDVAADAGRDRYYVVDSYRHQVLVYDGTGHLREHIGRSGGGADSTTTGSSEDSDAATARSHGGGEVGALRDTWENRGNAPGEFRYPFAIALLHDGSVAVSDQMNFRVQLFDTHGGFLRSIGQLGSTPGSFARPKGIAVDAENHLLVADGAFNNIQIFDTEGRLLLAFGQIGLGEGEQWLPMGVAVDAAGKIYVADRFNNRIQIYRGMRSPSSVRPGAGLESNPQ